MAEQFLPMDVMIAISALIYSFVLIRSDAKFSTNAPGTAEQTNRYRHGLRCCRGFSAPHAEPFLLPVVSGVDVATATTTIIQICLVDELHSQLSTTAEGTACDCAPNKPLCLGEKSQGYLVISRYSTDTSKPAQLHTETRVIHGFHRNVRIQ